MSFNPLAVCHVMLAATLLASPLLAQDASAPRVPAYIGSETCIDCHSDAAEAWAGSHHDLAWTLPQEPHLKGNFDNQSFEHKGVTTTLSRQDGDFYIESDGPDGALTRYRVEGVVGIAPLQQYLLETEPGRLQSFDVTWDVENERWYHLYPDLDLPASDGLHWTGPYKGWNPRCAECHATGYDKNYDPRTKTYDSTQAEIGVGCEACHGPGEAHQEWVLANDTYDPARWAKISDIGLTVDFDAGPEVLIQQCAGCHSRREPFEGGNPVPGTPYHDAYRLSTLRPGLYHPDGQILDEVYVYGSFLQSKMYAKGVSCIDCHDAHSATRIAEGNAVCTQCHSEAGNPRFESLPLKDYDDPSHHFHEAGSDGAQCKSCHMIERTYMGIDGRRDHSFRVPRPDLSIETGAPNACTDCHAEAGAEWAAAELEARFPESVHRGPHFSQVLAPARIDPASRIDDLVGIVEHRDLPGIVRASALDLAAAVATPDLATRLASQLRDPDPVVRAAAVGVQRAAPPTERVLRLAPVLADPSRAVRMAAAREFLPETGARLPARITADLDTAMGEWQASLLAKADFPETQMVLGGIGLTTRNIENALSGFQEAVRLDPQLVAAWSMIIRLNATVGDIPGAREALATAQSKNPGDPILQDLANQLP